ncbi:TPM domain-containing protein [Myroides phaeus]|uniref:TPM domain-containing protein n=1 Tax=Myroides phaeus TaxID=702745 RepID=UPI00130334DD|nr:TPM domain-containing protein [Myroides phaeus]
MAKKYLLFMLLASLSFNSCKQVGDKQATNIAVAQQNNFPKSLGSVSDYTNVLTLEQAKEIEQYIAAFEQQTSNEIVIALLESVPIERDFKRYCIELSNTWEVGKPGKHNGVTIIVDLKNKRAAIHTGDEINKVFTDDKCANILRDIAFPNFKQQQYYEGIMGSLIALIDIWNMDEYEHDL